MHGALNFSGKSSITILTENIENTSDTIKFEMAGMDAGNITLPTMKGMATIPSFTIENVAFSMGENHVITFAEQAFSSKIMVNGTEKEIKGSSISGTYNMADNSLSLKAVFKYGTMPFDLTFNIKAYYIKQAKAKKIDGPPPVSVMGLNVLEKGPNGKWYCGSFSGLYIWDRQQGISTDYFTGKLAPKEASAPFGKKAIAGMSLDFYSPVVADYHEGTSFAAQPAIMKQLPMSLWNVALEVHSGRIFIGNIATYVFIFIMGLLIAWCLWSGL